MMTRLFILALFLYVMPGMARVDSIIVIKETACDDVIVAYPDGSIREGFPWLWRNLMEQDFELIRMVEQCREDAGLAQYYNPNFRWHCSLDSNKIRIDLFDFEVRLQAAALQARAEKAKQLILYNLEVKNWERLDVLMGIFRRDQLELVKLRDK